MLVHLTYLALVAVIVTLFVWRETSYRKTIEGHLDLVADLILSWVETAPLERIKYYLNNKKIQAKLAREAMQDRIYKDLSRRIEQLESKNQDEEDEDLPLSPPIRASVSKIEPIMPTVEAVVQDLRNGSQLKDEPRA